MAIIVIVFPFITRPPVMKLVRFNVEFFKGLVSVAFLYTIAWCVFQWGFMEGKESAGYKFNQTTRAFAGVE